MNAASFLTLADWEFSQMFGEEDDPSSDSDSSGGEGSFLTIYRMHTYLLDNWISSLSFDTTGQFLAVGYNCGQVVVLTQQVR